MSLLDTVTLASLRRAYDRLGYPWFTGAYNLNVGAVRSNVGGATGAEPPDRPVRRRALRGLRGPARHAPSAQGLGHDGLRTQVPPAEDLVVPLRPPADADPAARPLTARCTTAARSTGYHTGYRALRQVGPAQFVADVDTDDNLDLGYVCLPGGRIELLPGTRPLSGVVLANRHRASRVRDLPLIGGYSAACTVWQSARDQAEEVALVERQIAAGYGARCTNVLLTRLAL